jgi:hypothetical protein
MAIAKHQCIRIPRDIKIWLQQQAACNLSSQSSEIVRSIRMRMEAEKRASGSATSSAKRPKASHG